MGPLSFDVCSVKERFRTDLLGCVNGTRESFYMTMRTDNLIIVDELVVPLKSIIGEYNGKLAVWGCTR